MSGAHLIRMVCTLCFALQITGCGPTRVFQDPEDYEEFIGDLNHRLLENPRDIEILVNLGVAYLRIANVTEANRILQQAHVLESNDPRVIYYLGMVQEVLGNEATALRLYERYPEFTHLSPYRRMLEGRYTWLIRRRAEAEARELLAEEALRQDVHERIIAVFPLNYQGSDSRYAAVGRGISEMISVDLANVRGLQVVERVRLQALLDEIRLAEEDYLDPASAPRAGRLVGAGRIVSGSFNVLGRENLRVDAGLWNLEAGGAPGLETRSDALNNIFRLQKELVYALLDEMNIELTPAEIERIEYIPTQNLQAFLAYSNGLLMEDQGRYARAAQFFNRARRLDPDFERAGTASDRAEGLSEAGGTIESALTAALQLETPAPPTINPLSERSSHLSNSINAGFLPGQDSRLAPQEIGRRDLPEPPDPPARN